MWNGSNWVQIATTKGASGIGYGTVRCLSVYNGNLIAGGYFTSVDGVRCNGIAGWNGSNWFAFDNGVGGVTPHVEAITVFPASGFSGRLYIGGTFSSLNSNPVPELPDGITVHGNL